MVIIDGHNVFFALDRDRSSNFEKDLNGWKDECLSKCDELSKAYILVLDGSVGFIRMVGLKKLGLKVS